MKTKEILGIILAIIIGGCIIATGLFLGLASQVDDVVDNTTEVVHETIVKEDNSDDSVVNLKEEVNNIENVVEEHTSNTVVEEHTEEHNVYDSNNTGDL